MMGLPDPDLNHEPHRKNITPGIVTAAGWRLCPFCDFAIAARRLRCLMSLFHSMHRMPPVCMMMIPLPFVPGAALMRHSWSRPPSGAVPQVSPVRSRRLLSGVNVFLKFASFSVPSCPAPSGTPEVSCMESVREFGHTEHGALRHLLGMLFVTDAWWKTAASGSETRSLFGLVRRGIRL